jgi:hypothetical protein
MGRRKGGSVNTEHKTIVSKRGGGYGFRCSCGEAPNRSTRQRKVAEQWARAHEAEKAAREDHPNG